MSVSGSTLSVVPTQITTLVICGLIAAVAFAVLGRRRRRYPVVVTVLVVILVFVTVLVLVGVDPFIATALVGAAATATVRLSSRVRES
ncbi:hypothetical protein [Micromonospora sp. NPDC049274]|uniref:hypothetical protein n=1 Tax=Micromonospora sp. NPDC049274 TaxID=3154829 RepID=UPI00343D1778